MGAWWLGFLIGGAFLLVSSVPLLFYANDLPGAATLRAEKVSEASGENKDDATDIIGDISRAELWIITKKLATNLTYIFVTLTAVTDSFLITAFASYGPKFVENQYSVSPTSAGMLFGKQNSPLKRFSKLSE